MTGLQFAVRMEGSPSSSRPPLLVAEDLVKNFGPTEALRGASCEIQSGEIVAIMGPSGSGKSTLLHCLAGILLPQSGTIQYAGQDMARMNEQQRSRLRLTEFGFVFQFGQLVPDLNGEENVALPLLLRGESRRAAIATAREWLEALDVQAAAGKVPGELSGGQAQRVAMARAFAIQPRVIFADEPTGALDSLAGEAVMELLTEAARERGTTVVIVTHDPRVAAYASREIVVRDGRVTAGGNDVKHILLDMRLAWRAGVGKNSARVSFFVRVIGVAFAVLVLLLATSASGALDSRGDRTTWRTQWGNGIDPDSPAAETGAWMQVGWEFDYYYGSEIQRVRVARYSPEAEVPPGLSRIPEPGEAFVSPAVMRLIQADPEVMAPRYAETIVGTISNAGLSDPNELVVISGHPANDTRDFGQFYRELPEGFDDLGITAFMWAVITIGVVVLLFPIALFIASAARLNAQESDARLAAFRLAGASPGRVRWIVAWESLLSALPGAALGLGMFYAARPVVARVHLEDAAFYPGDFAPNMLGLLVVLLTPIVVVAASLFGLRDVEISPLGVSRNAVRRKVRPFGLAVLALGFVALWYVLGNDDHRATPAGLVLSIVLILVGLAMAGTWIGHALSGALAGTVRTAPALLAFRRIVREPHASFRSVSGVTFAVFAGTLFLSLSAALEREVEVGDYSGFRGDVTFMRHEPGGGNDLENVPPGTSIVSIHERGGTLQSGTGTYFRIYEGNCDDFALVLRMEGGCEGRFAIRAGAGAQPGDEILVEGVDPPVTIVVPPDAYEFQIESFGTWLPDIVVPPGSLPGRAWAGGWWVALAPPDGVQQGSREFELIRTSAMRANPADTVYSASQFDAGAIGGIETMKSLVYAGTFAAFILAGATAAMTVAGSIIARRKSFALLRMAGVPLSALRKTVITEATLPLALVSAISAATAVGVSAMMIHRIGEGSVLPPPEFVLPLAAWLVVGLAFPLITLPLLGRVTAMERTRFE